MVLHPRRDSAEAIAKLLGWAAGHGAAVVGLPDEVGRIGGGVEPVDAAELAGCDLLVSLGGDGTMLRAMRLSQPAGVPVLGVNLGRLGFLAEVDVPDLPAALVEVRVEEQPFVRYAADAIIVATPTGSTAYSFSAGGPIVSPRAEGLLVIPVAPHSAFNRAVFLSAGEPVELQLLGASGRLAVEADGLLAGEVRPGNCAQVFLCSRAARVVRLGGTTFYQRARRKLRLADPAELDGPAGTAGAAGGGGQDVEVVPRWATRG